MKIALGADHAGFALKQQVADALTLAGHEVVDLGTDNANSTDYPDYAAAVAKQVASGAADRGVLVCSTGVGMSIAANKIRGVRAALAYNVEEVRLTRAHNDANVIAIGAKYTDAAGAGDLLRVFLETPFDGGRHALRVAKIAKLEQES